MPRSVEYHSGNFTISPETKFYTNLSAESRQALTDYLEGTSLGSVPFAESATGNNGIELNLCDSSIVTGNEAYRIEIDKKGVRLSANTETGIFYGLQRRHEDRLAHRKCDLLPTSRLIYRMASTLRKR